MKKLKGDESADGGAAQLPKYPIRKDDGGIGDARKQRRNRK